MTKRTRLNLNPKFYIFIAMAAAAVIGLLVLFIPGRSWGVVSYGSFGTNRDVSTAIIRDEESITVEKYDKLIYLAKEGEHVDIDAPIAQVLKWGYSDDMMQSLLQIESEIYRKQSELMSGVSDADLDSINASITVVLRSIRESVMQNSGKDLLDLELELKRLLSERSQRLKDKVYASEELSSLYAEEEIRQTQISQWSSSIVATKSGKVSFYFDGFEQALNAQKLDMITSDLVSRALSGTGAGSSPEDGSALLYRLVQDGEWYCAFLTNAYDPLRVVEGEAYSVVFDGFSATYSGIALAPVISGSKVVNILKFSMELGPFMGVRSIKANVSIEASGIKVDEDALRVQKNSEGIYGSPYIEIDMGDSKAVVEVDVLGIEGGKAIIRPKEGSLAEGQRFVKPGVSLWTKLKEAITG